MQHSWFKPRAYRHFDSPVGGAFAAKVLQPNFVKRHSWSPLISYTKRQKRYRPGIGKTDFKERSIMYASHRDACILSYFASELTGVLDERYAASGLGESVIAYRKLGKANYDFSAVALAYAHANAPCVALCFDVTGFFDSLDHKILKKQLASAFGWAELPAAWYSVFKSVTKFKHVERSALKSHPIFGIRMGELRREPIATIVEVRRAGIPILVNGNGFGIPQGTPISAALSNLYMWNLDVAMKAACDQVCALYQRYSDDILIICPPHAEKKVTDELEAALAILKLEIKAEKTERVTFDPTNPASFQYLGFTMSPTGALIRQSSLARQWRKARRMLKRTKSAGEAAIAAGRADKVYTKKVRRRLLPVVGVRNFSSYARRSSQALGSEKIVRQVRRLERMVEQELHELKRKPSANPD